MNIIERMIPNRRTAARLARRNRDLAAKVVELQAAGNKWAEVGTPGLETTSGFIQEAYSAELYWPDCEPLYSRIYRSDPEVAMVRTIFEAWASKQTISVEIPSVIGGIEQEKPNDDDQRAADFVQQALEDMEGGIGRWYTSCMCLVPFYGWGWWEAVPGLRRPDWRPPDDDGWRSNYDDGLIGYRRLALRRHSSFAQWELDDKTGRLTGMVQRDMPNADVTIPLDRSLHVTFGDNASPEGLATMEALWRLERIKYGLEVVLGIGYEHSAGHLSVTVAEGGPGMNTAAIKAAARSILTAQEGNYAAWPQGVTGTIIDVPFAAGAGLLEAIRYYGTMKLALLGMQWVARGAMANVGSYAEMSSSSGMALSVYNAMSEGFIHQADEQIIKRLFDFPSNREAFPSMTRRPRLTVERIQKEVSLAELAQFATAFAAILPMGDDDAVAIRRMTDFLPETLPEPEPEVAQQPAPAQPTEEEAEESMTEEGEPEQEGEEQAEGEKKAELARRPFTVSADELPAQIDPVSESLISPADIDRATRRFLNWADENDPLLAGLMRAKVVEGEEGPVE